VGQREDTARDEDGVDASVGVDDDAVGAGVHGQGVNLGVSLGVHCRYSCRLPPPHFLRLLGSPSEIWESHDLNHPRCENSHYGRPRTGE